MREALRRRCLWWACLAAAARVVAPVVVAGAAARMVKDVQGEGQCEVLDLSKASPAYLLPTTITLKPSAVQWRLDVTLGQREPAVCVRLEDKQSRLRVMATIRHCDEGDVSDYSYLNVTAPPGVWTSLRVDVASNAVTVSAMDGTNTSVVTQGSPLPRDGPQVALTGKRDVEAAVGCRSSCPGYRHASKGNDKKVTVKQWDVDSVHFYFRPGEDFEKLEYEVTCTTPLGHRTFPHVTDITLNPALSRNLWRLVHLQHQKGLVTVQLDHRPLENKTLSDCTFTGHTIRVLGDSLFSFNCNPFTGNVERTEEADTSLAQAGVTPFVAANIGWAIVVVALLLAMVTLWVQLSKSQNSRYENKTKKSSSNNNIEEYAYDSPGTFQGDAMKDKKKTANKNRNTLP